MATKKNDAPEFDEPVVAKKKRPVHTPVETYADLPGAAPAAANFREMSKVEALRWLSEENKTGASYKATPRLKAAFRQAVALEGLGSVNNALNAYMTDLVMKHRDEIELSI